MREYFYLVSSLVTLSPEVKPLFTSDSFLELCRGQIAESEWNILAATELIDDGTLKSRLNSDCVLRQYWAWDGSLRNALLDVLAADGSGVKYKRVESEFFSETAGIKNEAFAQNNPLEREEFLFTARWNFLDELAQKHQFDFNVLVIYRLKLLLLEQRQKYHHESGVKNLENLVEELLNQRSDASNPGN
ncbi:MAG: hypothetical protein RR060_04635 [Victivallaceae bacterium]